MSHYASPERRQMNQDRRNAKRERTTERRTAREQKYGTGRAARIVY